MESVGQPGLSGSCNLLGVPGLDPLEADDDECEVVIGIRPKSSPLPRRRSSDSDEDWGPEPPLSGSRRVSFADAKGLSLVRVKQFETWDVPKLPDCDTCEGAGRDAEVYFLSPLTFSLPLSTEELFVRVREQRMELETIELLPGTTILRGVIRVLNISFNKAVYVRTTLDTWSSHFDLLAEYMPGSSDSLTDRFSFKLTLVPPFGEQGARVDFCLRYETPVGTFWANNNDRNYVLFCQRREKERTEASQKERVNKKSCLRTVSRSVSIVESISSTEASSQENSTKMSTERGEMADAVKAEQISDGQSGTSEEDRQELLTENRRNCSRRRGRKGARMARVRDYFSQRNGGPDDSERDESPPEVNQAAQEETPEPKHSCVPSFPEETSKSEGSHFVSETLGTRSELFVEHVPRDTSPARGHASDGETDESESVDLADWATLTGGGRDTVIPYNPSNDEPASAENINKPVSEAEESAAQPADSDISEGSSGGPDSQTNSFSFGTVLAPLYHQAFGRVGNESDWRNPVQATLHAGDLSYRDAERRQTRCCVTSDDEVSQGHASRESSQEYLVTNSLPMEKEETSFSVTANGIRAETLRDPDEVIRSDRRRTNSPEVPETIPGAAVAHPHAANISNTDLLKLQKPAESSHLQGEAREDDLTLDPKLPEHTCTRTKARRDETREVVSSFMSLRPPGSVSERVSDETGRHASGKGAGDCEDDVCETVTTSTTAAVSEGGNAFEALHHLNPKRMNDSATGETEVGCVSSFDIVEETDVTMPQMPLETNNVEEGNKVANNSAETEIIGETFVELVDEDEENVERREIEAADAKRGDSRVADTPEVNWEMMVEEEEKSISTDEEESKATRSQTVGRDRGRLEDAGTLESKDTTEDQVVWEIKAARERMNEAEDVDVSEGVQKIGEEIGEIVAGKDGVEVAKESQYVRAANEAGDEDLAEDVEEEKREKEKETELEEEHHFAEEVDIEDTNVQNGEDVEEGEDTEIDPSDDDGAGVEWEDQVKPRGVDLEEENPDYKEECFGESEITTREDGQNEAGCFEVSSDISQNKVGDASSAPVNNVQGKRVMHRENGRIPTEMRLYEEEDFQQSEEIVPRDLTKAAGDESESPAGGSLVFTYKPENDETSDDDSASAESDSDDEVELYMHCLRAVHTGAQAQADRNKDAGFDAGKLRQTRGKLLPMPSISESQDEEDFPGRLLDTHEDVETADVQPAAPPASNGQESIERNVSRWRETFSCGNISKTLLYATLLVVFLVVAHRYDFLACFGLYLISVVWLYCQGERQPKQQRKQQNKLN